MNYVVKESNKDGDEFVLRTDLDEYWLEKNGETVLHFKEDSDFAVKQHNAIISRDNHEVIIETREQMI